MTLFDVLTCNDAATTAGCAASPRVLVAKLREWDRLAIRASTQARIYLWMKIRWLRKGCSGGEEPPVGRTNTTARLQALRSTFDGFSPTNLAF